MEELLKKREFEKIEKILLNRLQKENDNVELLFQLAMVYLQFPFVNEERAIEYLNRILAIEKYNFEALVIKMYLQNFYYGEMDQDFEVITNYKWNDPYKTSIAYYVCSWQFHWWDKNPNIEQRMQLLRKSIEACPELVYTYKEQRDIYMELNKYDDAKECYQKAVDNVKSTEYPYEDYLNPQAFIDEYVSGVSLSDVNYDWLKEKANMDEILKLK